MAAGADQGFAGEGPAGAAARGTADPACGRNSGASVAGTEAAVLQSNGPQSANERS